MFISRFLKDVFTYISDYFVNQEKKKQNAIRLEKELQKFKEIQNDQTKTEQEKKDAFKDFIRGTNT